jgi:L-ascorbate metabolism protein UlaG (beta-lactamase superfamily)
MTSGNLNCETAGQRDEVKKRVAITRIANACALIETSGGAVLTDPYFDDHWFMRLHEAIGLKAAELPELRAIIGGHGVFDHWQPASLRDYPYKQHTPVFVATRAMELKARKAGFSNVEVVAWFETRQLSDDLRIEVVPAHRFAGQNVNSYVITSHGFSVFVGTEARDLDPLKRYRATRQAVDMAMLPIDGSTLLGHRLVMSAEEALTGARVLGARTLIPFHYALKAIPFLLRTPGSLQDLLHRSAGGFDGEVLALETGVTLRR